MERVKGNWRECVRVLVAAHTLGYTCVWTHCDTRAHTHTYRPPAGEFHPTWHHFSRQTFLINYPMKACVMLFRVVDSGQDILHMEQRKYWTHTKTWAFLRKYTVILQMSRKKKLFSDFQSELSGGFLWGKPISTRAWYTRVFTQVFQSTSWVRLYWMLSWSR